MREQIELPKGTFYVIASVCAAIIFLTSIEMLLRAKDVGLFQMWLSNLDSNPSLLGQTEEELYSTYLNMCLSTFFVRTITPIGLALHSYYTLTKLRVNKFFVIIWVLLLIGTLVLTVIGEPYFSIFFILSGIGYITLVITMFYLGKQLYNIRSL